MAEKNTANIGFEKQIWDAACVLWGHIPASEYRNVIIGLPFNAPLNELDTELQTYGCRQNNPDICGNNGLAGVCAFVSKDGICRKPWKTI